MHQSRGHGIDDQQKQNDADTEEEVAERARDVFPAQPCVANAMLIQPAVGHEPVVPAFAVMEHFSMGKCVLKKGIEKMKPAASNASSEWMMRAMLRIQPGRNFVKNTGNHRTNPDEPMLTTHQHTA